MSRNQLIKYAVDNFHIVSTDEGHIFNLDKHGIMHQTDNGRYYTVSLYRKTLLVHRIVAYCWFGDSMFGHDIVVDHINRNSHDNRAANLRLLTYRGNMAFKKRVPINLEKANEIKNKYSTGEYSQAKLASEYSMPIGQIQGIIKS